MIAIGFVEQIIGGYGRVGAIVLGHCLPEKYCPLSVLRQPELIQAPASGTLVGALASGRAMQVQDHINTRFCGHTDGAIQPLESVRTKLPRRSVVFEDVVVDG